MKKISKISILFFSLALFFLTVSAVLAAPSISGVGGVVSHGGMVTITGSSFGVKSPAMPRVWCDFENNTVGELDRTATGNATACVGSFGTTGTIHTVNSTNSPIGRWWITNTGSYSGSKGAKYIYNIVNNGLTGVPGTDRSTNHLGYDRIGMKEFFIAYKYRLDANFLHSTGNYKHFFVFDPTGAKEPHSTFGWQNYVCPSPGWGGGATHWQIKYFPAAVSETSRTDFESIDDGRWRSDEIAYKLDSVAEACDGSIQWWISGKRYFNLQNACMRHAGITTEPARLEMTTYSQFYTCNTTYDSGIPAVGAKVAYDDIYIDSTRARVMIGNASTFDASTHREPLIPTSWSASSITAYFNQGAFANGSQAYIFVVDASGNASPGRAITINGTPPPTCTSFTYSAWGTCQSSGTQTRTITSSSPSGCTGGSPITTQTCGFSPATCTSFTYSAWGACQTDNTQTRTVSSSSPASCTGGDPVLSQSCTYVPPDQSQTLLLGNNTQETGIINANTNQTYLRLMAASLSGQAQKAHISYNNTNSAGCKVLVYDNDKNLLEAVLVPRSGTGWSSASMAGTTNITSGAQYYIGVVCPGYQEIDSSASALLKTVPDSSGSSYATPLNPLTGEYNLTGGDLSVYISGSSGGTTPPQACGDQSCNNGETCSTCPGDCGACAKTYTLTDFTNLVTDWLKSMTGSLADVNLDNKVNSKDLGIMMSNWAL